MKKNITKIEYNSKEYIFEYIFGPSRLRIPSIDYPQIQEDIILIKEATSFYPTFDRFKDKPNEDIKVRSYILKNNIPEKDLKCKSPHCNNYVKFNSPSKGFVDYCSPFCANTSDEFQKAARKTRIKNGYESSKKIIKKNGIKNIDKWKNKSFILSNFINIDKTFNIYKFQEFFNCGNATAYKHLKSMDIEYNKTQKQSQYEKDIINFLQNHVADVEDRDKSLINKEIDILIKSNRFGIEFNGLMYHSHGTSKFSPFNNPSIEPKRHLDKTIQMEDKDFQLFHIFENEWVDEKKQDIWKSMLLNKIGLSQTIFAKKCSIKEISKKETYDFLEKNHLQGKNPSDINLGLFMNDELYSIMTFGKPRYNKVIEYELIRFCNKKFYNIVGGASKLLKYFEKNYNPKSILSYANRRWSQGNLYVKLGFNLEKINNPNFFYFKTPFKKYDKLYSRQTFQKHKLKYKLEIFDKKLTAHENMFNNDYRVIFDCGNLTYIKEYNNG